MRNNYTINELTIRSFKFAKINSINPLTYDNLLKALRINFLLLEHKNRSFTFQSLLKLATTDDIDHFIDGLYGYFGFEIKRIASAPYHAQPHKQNLKLLFNQLILVSDDVNIEDIKQDPLFKDLIIEGYDDISMFKLHKYRDVEFITTLDEDEFYQSCLEELASCDDEYRTNYFEIVNKVMPHITPTQLADINIINKDNVKHLLIPCIYNDNFSDEDKLAIMHHITNNTFEAISNLQRVVSCGHYKIKRKYKRLFSKFLDKYDNLLEALIYEPRFIKRNHYILNYIDYSRYGKNPDNLDDVVKFRNNQYNTVYQLREQYLAKGDVNSAINVLAKYPQILIKDVRYLLRQGADPLLLIEAISNKIEEVDIKQVVSALNHLGDLDDNINTNTWNVLRSILVNKLKTKQLPIFGKQVYLDSTNVDITNSHIIPNHCVKWDGYNLFGLAINVVPAFAKDFCCVGVVVENNNAEAQEIDIHRHSATSFYNDYGFVYDDPIINGVRTQEVHDTCTNMEDIIRVGIYTCDRPSFTYLDKAKLSIMVTADFGSGEETREVMSIDLTKLRANKLHILEFRSFNRYIKFLGDPNYSHGERDHSRAINKAIKPITFSLAQFIDALFEAQEVKEVCREAQADIKLSVLSNDESIGLANNNYFLDEF